MAETVDFLLSQILAGNTLLNQVSVHDRSSNFSRDYARWIQSSVVALRHAGLDNYAEMIERQDADAEGSEYTTARITGLLESARECLLGGFIGRLKHLLNAQMFGELVPQARELIRASHLIPAAVLGRIAIERWLRDQAELAGLPSYATDKAAKLNDALKAAAKITQPQWRFNQAYLDVGNKAAHGETDQITELDVTRMIDYVESNCAK